MTSQPPQETGANTGEHDQECTACGSTELDTSIPDVDPVCQSCGIVVSADIDIDSPFDNPDHESEEFRSWGAYHTVRNSTEQQIAQALEILEKLGDRLQPGMDVREQAAEYYTEASVETFTDGRSTDLVAAVCFRMAGQACDAPIPLNRIARAADVERSGLRRICTAFRRELDVSPSPCPPEEYLDGLTETFGLDDSTRLTAGKLVAAMSPLSTSGKHPGAIAGAALYVAADGAITQRDVAESTGLTTETIRSRVKDCRDAVPEEGISRLKADESQGRSENV